MCGVALGSIYDFQPATAHEDIMMKRTWDCRGWLAQAGESADENFKRNDCASLQLAIGR
jgi:hypothetical protein